MTNVMPINLGNAPSAPASPLRTRSYKNTATEKLTALHSSNKTRTKTRKEQSPEPFTVANNVSYLVLTCLLRKSVTSTLLRPSMTSERPDFTPSRNPTSTSFKNPYSSDSDASAPAFSSKMKKTIFVLQNYNQCRTNHSSKQIIRQDKRFRHFSDSLFTNVKKESGGGQCHFYLLSYLITPLSLFKISFLRTLINLLKPT